MMKVFKSMPTEASPLIFIDETGETPATTLRWCMNYNQSALMVHLDPASCKAQEPVKVEPLFAVFPDAKHCMWAVT